MQQRSLLFMLSPSIVPYSIREPAKISDGGTPFDSEEKCHMKKRFPTSLLLLTFLLFTLQCHTVYGSEDQPLIAGSQLSGFTLPAPDSQQTSRYLGLKTMDPYTISQIDAKLVLIEVLSAFCPHCHANAPVINRLYQVIQKDAAFAKDVKIIGICIGNNKTQIEAFKKNFNVSFPLIPDEKLAIAHAMGVTETPTMVLVTHSGKVLASHCGVIQDFDGFLKDMRENQKKP
jgi:peroxiredoxin